MSKPKKKTTVLVLDEDSARTRSLMKLLASSGYDCTNVASVEQLVAEHDGTQPTGVIANPQLLNVPLAPQKAKKSNAGMAPYLVVASGHMLDEALRATRLGTVSLVPRSYAEDELLAAISKAVTEDVRHARLRVRQRAIEQRIATLTTGERQVLDLVVDGRANKVIAGRLGIAMRTVERRRQRILEKMRAKSMAEVVGMLVEARASGATP